MRAWGVDFVGERDRVVLHPEHRTSFSIGDLRGGTRTVGTCPQARLVRAEIRRRDETEPIDTLGRRIEYGQRPRVRLDTRKEPSGKAGGVGLSRSALDQWENRRAADNSEACPGFLGGPEESRHACIESVVAGDGRKRRNEYMRTGDHLLEEGGVVHATGALGDSSRKARSVAP